jgi:membrane-bound inhibitor of C-type lysozyme
MNFLRSRLHAVPVLCALAAPLPLSAQVVEGPSYTGDTRVYRCAGPRLVSVVYVNLKGGESLAVLSWRGRLHLMRAMPVASGSAYTSVDEEAGVRWRTKGEEGTLSFMAADHTAQEKMLARDCRAEAR